MIARYGKNKVTIPREKYPQVHTKGELSKYIKMPTKTGEDNTF
jgi:hypothetical protein